MSWAWRLVESNILGNTLSQEHPVINRECEMCESNDRDAVFHWDISSRSIRPYQHWRRILNTLSTLSAKEKLWPSLPLDLWQDTYATLHMWTQIVGKIRLALSPPVNHWWHCALYVSARGLTTSAMPYHNRFVELEFDFLAHKLVIRTSFDLAVTRFSGRRAPERPGANLITREAYSHECISAGFWPGAGYGGPAFYSYAAPAPPGLENESAGPGFYSPEMCEFLLKYDDV